MYRGTASSLVKCVSLRPGDETGYLSEPRALTAHPVIQSKDPRQIMDGVFLCRALSAVPYPKFDSSLLETPNADKYSFNDSPKKFQVPARRVFPRKRYRMQSARYFKQTFTAADSSAVVKATMGIWCWNAADRFNLTSTSCPLSPEEPLHAVPIGQPAVRSEGHISKVDKKFLICPVG